MMRNRPCSWFLIMTKKLWSYASRHANSEVTLQPRWLRSKELNVDSEFRAVFRVAKKWRWFLLFSFLSNLSVMWPPYKCRIKRIEKRSRRVEYILSLISSYDFVTSPASLCIRTLLIITQVLTHIVGREKRKFGAWRGHVNLTENRVLSCEMQVVLRALVAICYLLGS
jgi:hypothetical protein